MIEYENHRIARWVVSSIVEETDLLNIAKNVGLCDGFIDDVITYMSNLEKRVAKVINQTESLIGGKYE